MNSSVIKAPKHLCIYKEDFINITYDFLFDINDSVMLKKKSVVVDLREVEMVTAAASVLLFSIVNTCQLFFGNLNQVRCIFPTEKTSSVGYQYIVKTGLARALHSGSTEKLNDLVASNIYFQSSINPSQHLVSTVNFLSSKAKFTSHQFQMLTSGIAEAMLNVSHHAYKDPVKGAQVHLEKIDIVNRIGERWWQCGWFDENSNSWVFIICDLGLGVPFTYSQELRKNKNYNLIRELSISALKEAFTLGNSRFVGQGRGNGSEDIKSVVGTVCNETESLLVYSGGVKYSYNTQMSEPVVESLDNFFQGTLIEWTLSLGDRG